MTPETVVAYMREVKDTWKRLDVALERLIQADDAVVALLRETAEARDSDFEVTTETAMVLRVRGNKIVEARGYLRRDEALAAVGWLGRLCWRRRRSARSVRATRSGSSRTWR
jgi:ketosteroid isomerase-like protein